jgi:hypothetical protein
MLCKQKAALGDRCYWLKYGGAKQDIDVEAEDTHERNAGNFTSAGWLRERVDGEKRRQQELMNFTRARWKLATTGNWVGPFPALFSFLAHVKFCSSPVRQRGLVLNGSVSSELKAAFEEYKQQARFKPSRQWKGCQKSGT